MRAKIQAQRHIERRGDTRYPLERLAKIQAGTNTPQCYCLVTDIAGGGVRLNVYGCDVPDEFVLAFFGDGPAKGGTYTVIWRLGQEIGAKFVRGASHGQDPRNSSN